MRFDLHNSSSSVRLHVAASAGCALSGFAAVMVSAALGSGLGIIVGLAWLAVAATSAIGLRAIDRLARDLSTANRRLDDLCARLNRLEQSIAAVAHPARETALGVPGGAETVVDLAASQADPSAITAATLDRSRFPRLAALLSDEPWPAGLHPSATALDSNSRNEVGRPAALSAAAPLHAPQAAPPPLRGPLLDSVATRNLMQTWDVAMRNGDVKTCRRILSVMLDTAEAEAVNRMRRDFAALEDRTEDALRRRFALSVAHRDLAGILGVGADICDLLPDRAIADEYRRLAPHLARAQAKTAARPAGAVAPERAGGVGRAFSTAGP